MTKLIEALVLPFPMRFFFATRFLLRQKTARVCLISPFVDALKVLFGARHAAADELHLVDSFAA